MTPWLHQLSMEGRLFMAGTGVEEDAVAGGVALDDTAATFTLVSPLGGNLIIPISFTLARDTEGANNETTNALLHLAYTQANRNATGTLMEAINLRGDQSPAATARFLNTVTLDASVAADYVSLSMRIHIIEGWQSTETAVAGGSETEGFGPQYGGFTTVFEYNYDFLKHHVPLILTEGASISAFTGCDTTADGYNGHMIWAELPADIYGL